MHDRTVIRGRGCWNCKAFLNDEGAKKHFMMLRARDLTNRAAKGDLYEPPLYEKVATLIDHGQVGICLKGKSQADFIHYQYLCDAWNGRDGSSLATQGHPLDALPGEELSDAVDKQVANKKRSLD